MMYAVSSFYCIGILQNFFHLLNKLRIFIEYLLWARHYSRCWDIATSKTSKVPRVWSLTMQWERQNINRSIHNKKTFGSDKFYIENKLGWCDTELIGGYFKLDVKGYLFILYNIGHTKLETSCQVIGQQGKLMTCGRSLFTSGCFNAI